MNRRGDSSLIRGAREERATESAGRGGYRMRSGKHFVAERVVTCLFAAGIAIAWTARARAQSPPASDSGSTGSSGSTSSGASAGSSSGGASTPAGEMYASTPSPAGKGTSLQSTTDAKDFHARLGSKVDDTPYLQYGFSLVAESVLSAGKICKSSEPCILGSGGGLVLRAGVRSGSPWYVGGAYELSKQDPNNLYRFATLQQLRGEFRYYIETGRDMTPLFTAGAGIAGYGNEWTVDTWGPMAFIGVGFEFQVSRTAVMGVQAAYRGFATGRFADPGTSTPRAPGLASFFALEFVLEGRDPLKD